MYTEEQEQDASWLLRTLVILLMNVLGGLAALVLCLTRTQSTFEWPMTCPGTVRRCLGQKMTKSYLFANKSVIHQEGESIAYAFR